MKIIKRHDDVSEQKYRALFVPKLKAQPFFNERRPPREAKLLRSRLQLRSAPRSAALQAAL